jgi:hypothetical protein
MIKTKIADKLNWIGIEPYLVRSYNRL